MTKTELIQLIPLVTAITAILTLLLTILQIYKVRLEIHKEKIKALKEESEAKEKVIVVFVGLDEIKDYGQSVDFWKEREQRRNKGHFHGYMDPASALLANFLKFLEPVSVVANMIFPVAIINNINLLTYFATISTICLGLGSASLIISRFTIASDSVKWTIAIAALIISFMFILLITKSADKFIWNIFLKSKEKKKEEESSKKE